MPSPPAWCHPAWSPVRGLYLYAGLTLVAGCLLPGLAYVAVGHLLPDPEQANLVMLLGDACRAWCLAEVARLVWTAGGTLADLMSSRPSKIARLREGKEAVLAGTNQ